MCIYVLQASMVFIWSDSSERARKRSLPLFRVSNPCLGCPTLHADSGKRFADSGKSLNERKNGPSRYLEDYTYDLNKLHPKGLDQSLGKMLAITPKEI